MEGVKTIELIDFDFKDNIEEECLDGSENIEIKELQDLISNKSIYGLIYDSMHKIAILMNEKAVKKAKRNKIEEALKILTEVEKILDYAANCGKKLDRNIIVLTLYNIAASYQSLWQLEECSKYLEAVIFNLKSSLEEELKTQNEKLLKENLRVEDFNSIRIKTLNTLIQTQLQYCAIHSQLGKHELAFQLAKDIEITIIKFFRECNNSCESLYSKLESQSGVLLSPLLSEIRDKKYVPGKLTSRKLSSSQKFTYKQEVPFSKILLENAFPILKEILTKKVYDENNVSTLKENLFSLKKSVYYWKNNPENNEKHLLNEISSKGTISNDNRNILGLSLQNDWLENFNIGNIMHLNLMGYEEYSNYTEFIFEISRKKLMEKILLLSICYFTIATELRFMEQDKNPETSNPEIEIQEKSEIFILSEIYHLRSIEAYCKFIKSTSPYISHLISSYHKHYNQILEIIVELILTKPEESQSNTDRYSIDTNDFEVMGHKSRGNLSARSHNELKKEKESNQTLSMRKTDRPSGILTSRKSNPTVKTTEKKRKINFKQVKEKSKSCLDPALLPSKSKKKEYKEKPLSKIIEEELKSKDQRLSFLEKINEIKRKMKKDYYEDDFKTSFFKNLGLTFANFSVVDKVHQSTLKNRKNFKF